MTENTKRDEIINESDIDIHQLTQITDYEGHDLRPYEVYYSNHQLYQFKKIENKPTFIKLLLSPDGYYQIMVNKEPLYICQKELDSNKRVINKNKWNKERVKTKFSKYFFSEFEYIYPKPTNDDNYKLFITANAFLNNYSAEEERPMKMIEFWLKNIFMGFFTNCHVNLFEQKKKLKKWIEHYGRPTFLKITTIKSLRKETKEEEEEMPKK